MSDQNGNLPPMPPVPPLVGQVMPQPVGTPPAPPSSDAPQEATAEGALDDLDILVSLALDDVPDPVILKAGTKVNLECTSAKLKLSKERNVYLGFAFKVQGYDAEPIYDNFCSLPTTRDDADKTKEKKRRIKDMATRFQVPFIEVDNYLSYARQQLIADPSTVDNCQPFIGKVHVATLKVDTSGDSPRNTVGTWS